MRETKNLHRDRTNTKAENLLALGNPTFGKRTLEKVRRIYQNDKLDPLPEAEREVIALKSLCDTALGKVQRGEGMIGLAWSLFVAGSPTIIASQWKVDSASTTELMLEFHKNLKSKNTKSEAYAKLP